MKKTVLCLLSILLIAFQISARGADVFVEGVTVDCGYWTQARQARRAVSLEHYVLGFLDGFSAGREREFWRANGRLISREAAYLWIDNYCKSNPLKPIVTGLWELFNERPKQQK